MPPKPPKPTPPSHRRFAALVDRLASSRDVAAAHMFGMPSAKIVGGRMFMAMYDDDAVFKLDPATRAEALALDGAEPFDPAGGRPMKEWVRVPLAHAAEWEHLSEAAEAFVRG